MLKVLIIKFKKKHVNKLYSISNFTWVR